MVTSTVSHEINKDNIEIYFYICNIWTHNLQHFSRKMYRKIDCLTISRLHTVKLFVIMFNEFLTWIIHCIDICKGLAQNIRLLFILNYSLLVNVSFMIYNSPFFTILKLLKSHLEKYSLYKKKMVQSDFLNSRYDLCSKCICIWYHVKAE